MIDTRLLVIGIACLATAAVGLALLLRPDTHLAASRRRIEAGKPLPLEALSQRLFPSAETRRGYRLVGLAIIVVAAALFAFSFLRIAQG